MVVKRVSPAEAAQLMEHQGYVYLDVRSVPEFEAGHPAGAYNVPIMHRTHSGMEPNGDFVRVLSAAFPKDAKLVIGCRSGGRSLRAAELMTQAGFQNVVDQRAGVAGARDAFGQLQEPGWVAAGLEIASDPDPERSYQALLAKASG